MAARFPLQSMGETAENVAEKWKIAREEQDAFALASQKKAAAAIAARAFDRGDRRRVPIPQKKGEPVVFVEGRVAPRRHDARGAREAASRSSAKAAR